jgi:Sulfite exporter TauE/SafE
MTADPLFWLAAVIAVTALGLSKGGFSGIGVMAVPVMALVVSPLQAAGILLPILLAQDVVTIWSYRREWDGWNLAVLIPGQLIGAAAGWLLAAYVSDAAVRLFVGTIAIVFTLNYWFGKRPHRLSGRAGWLCRRAHRNPGACRSAAATDLPAITAAQERGFRRHADVFVLRQQSHESRALLHARTAFAAKPDAVACALAARSGEQSRRNFYRAPDAGDPLLYDRLHSDFAGRIGARP